MSGTRVSYRDEQQPLEGYLAAHHSAANLPGVLLVPSWLNVSESICRRADRLADLGYAAFVVDLFGVGVRPGPPQNPMNVVGPFLNDRLRLRGRLCAGLQAFRQRPESNSDHIAAIGYCIGGCGVLEVKTVRKELDERLQKLKRAESLIVEDPETMRGTPVYRGTRIPVDLIADMLKQGATVEEVIEGYPALDRERIELAPLYLRAFPRRGRPAARPWGKRKPIRTTRHPRDMARST